MKIRLLEDFSNKVEIPGLSRTTTRSRVDKTPTNSPEMKALFGNCPVTISTQSYYYNSDIGRVPNNIIVKTDGGELQIIVNVRVYSWNGASHSLNPPQLDWAVAFDLLPEWEDKRTIVSFDYKPVTTVEVSLVTKSAPAETLGLSSQFKPDVAGKIEYVFEAGGVRVFQNNVLVYQNPNMKSAGLGRVSPRTNSNSSQINFTMANLAIVTVPVESSIRRLSNVRIERTYITEDDQGPVDLDDPINSNEPIGTQRRTVSRPVKFTPGTPVTLGEQERILGMESTLSVVSDTAERFTVRVSDGETELSEDVHEVDSTLQPRVTVGDYSLGDDPEDYGQVRIELSVEDLDGTP